MISARRFKRNFRCFLIPFEMILVWTLAPAALLVYWLRLVVLKGVRSATAISQRAGS